MEKIGEILKAPGRENLARTMPQPSQPSWAGLLWTLAQQKYKELTPPEVALWKAKLSGYPNDLVEWALLNYNDEYFPDPGKICKMIERKRESNFQAQEQAEWQAWKAVQKQAEKEGRLASPEDYEYLRSKFREVASQPKQVTSSGRADGSRQEVAAVPQSGDTGTGAVVTPDGSNGENNQAKSVG